MDDSDPLGLIGQTLRGSWQVTRLIHTGAMSLVYEATTAASSQRAAVKCYVGLADVPQDLQNSLREAFITVGRDVARLARAYDGLVQPLGGEWLPMDNGTEVPCIILEWLEGNTLEALLDAEVGHFRRTTSEVLELMAAPLEAIAAAHQLGLVHQDIKPSNFYVCGDTIKAGVEIRILDLNLAKLERAGEESVPRPSVLFMTPHYAAPEQFRGDDPLIGTWTDVFSLALVLIELMAGYGPVMRGATIEELQQASEDPDERPSPRTLGLDVPNTVEAVFRRALAVDIRERFRSAGAFLRALHAAVAAEGRITSSAISRVSGVLEFEPDPDSPPRVVQVPLASPTGTQIAPVPRDNPRITGETVIAQSPAVTGHTVVARPPTRKD